MQITSTRHGIPGTEVFLDPAVETNSGLSRPCVASCANVTTFDQGLVRRRIGYLSDAAMQQIEACLKTVLELHEAGPRCSRRRRLGAARGIVGDRRLRGLGLRGGGGGGRELAALPEPANPPLLIFTIVPTMLTPAGPMSTKLPPTFSVNCVPASMTTVVPPLR